MKYFRMSYEEVVFNRSYLNILLLNRSIPSFNHDKEKGGSNSVPSGMKPINGNYRHESELFAGLM